MELIEANLFRLCQLDQVLYALRADEYSKPLDVILGASLGKHFRHIAENYILLLDREDEKVNYDLRPRAQDWEVNIESMREVLKQIQDKLENIEENQPIQWTARLSTERNEESVAPSSLFRELAYNLEHCVHHMAIIRIAWNQLRPNEPMDVSFGMAASTLRYHQKLKMA